MWNYRIIKFKTEPPYEEDSECYGMYETYYNNAGEVCAHDDAPTIVGDSVEDIKKTLKMMMDDANKHDTLDGDQIKFSNFDGMPRSGEYQPFDPEDEGLMGDLTQ